MKKSSKAKNQTAKPDISVLESLSKRLEILEKKVNSLEEALQIQNENMDQLITKYSVVSELEKSMEARLQNVNADIRDIYEEQVIINNKITNVNTMYAKQSKFVVNEHQLKKKTAVAKITTSSTQTDLTNISRDLVYVTQSTQTKIDRPQGINKTLESSRSLSSKIAGMNKFESQPKSINTHSAEPSVKNLKEHKRRVLLDIPKRLQSSNDPEINSIQSNEDPKILRNKNEEQLIENQPSEIENPWTTKTSKILKRRHSNISVKPEVKLGEAETRSRETANNTRLQVRDTYRRKRCLLIHDGTFAGFQQNRFSSQLEVTEYYSSSIANMSEDGRIKELISKERPECIFIHVGARDIQLKRNVASIKHELESMMYYLLEKTRANICFSTIVPTSNSQELNNYGMEVNATIEKLVSHAREININNRSCLFSYNNDSMSDHNKLTPEGTSKLSVGGKLIMWKRLDDGLRKTLRLSRKKLSQDRNTDTDINRSYRYD